MEPPNSANKRRAYPRSSGTESRPPCFPVPRAAPAPDASSSSQSGIIHTNTNTSEAPCSPSASLPRSDGLDDDDDDDNDNDNNDNNNNNNNNGHPDCLLHDLVPLHDDLRTWLEHTGFWDVDYRRGILADVRRLRGLEAERASVLMRIRDSKPANPTDGESTALVPVTAAPSGTGGTTSCPPTSTSTSASASTSTSNSNSTSVSVRPKPATQQANYAPIGPVRRHMPSRATKKSE
ncbi:hypothetical protein E4U54_004124 [Claviceps lovelessii]|nr:hypothetical protein E4U54_004124 [Claviceps lovelessii]